LHILLYKTQAICGATKARVVTASLPQPTSQQTTDRTLVTSFFIKKNKKGYVYIYKFIFIYSHILYFTAHIQKEKTNLKFSLFPLDFI